MISITETIILADDEINERFIRASGPGGQNVNKVSTAVQLRFDAAHCPTLPHAVYRRLATLAGRRMTRDGVIVLTVDTHRSRERNREEAKQRLIELIRTAAKPPKYRRPTRPSAGVKERRLERKKKTAQIKKNRGRVRHFD
ncbi:alternative ribosome rescue aminoacyl-tRNA hydrolase ArfB [Magnetospira sp. QH-2]|uniref:alternative ribosome rescue aminoacyl-tRNA hydrolase ArfB n=1 Tax=Magnetospira sp. (strain QH-2) TaxID=1288970 RepID=UPI0003E80C3A|nr:alternative ribosome rescue aminoacyl-tRNA hydrolase ArfB [Magnetospira sp. QH-2]CCQ72698.1 putative Class I peptide chain release factor domain protein [Magnetospira sp. QH-2]